MCDAVKLSITVTLTVSGLSSSSLYRWEATTDPEVSDSVTVAVLIVPSPQSTIAV